MTGSGSVTSKGTVTHQIGLSAGPLEYVDTGGPGPVVVLLHGLLMDASLWTEVMADLAHDHRCIAPTLPLGAHRHGVTLDGSLRAVAALVEELLERLELVDVTLAGNDTGGALVQLLMADHAARVGRVVLASCDAFDNLPPGATGKALVTAGRLPASLFGLFMQQMRLRPLRRLPVAFGWLTKRGDGVTAGWLTPVLTQPEIRRDTVRVLRGIAADRGLLLRTAQSLGNFDRPALIVWAAEDRVMPPAHGRRLAELLPRARLVEIEDSYTLIPLDQPQALAEAIRDFIREPQ